MRQPLPSVSTKLGLHHCTWCVQNARCHHKEGNKRILFENAYNLFHRTIFLDNYGVCGEDTPSQSPGWWGASGTEITHPSECRVLDKRPGFTFIKYQHPVNWNYPDQVTIINATTVDFNTPGSSNRDYMSGEMVAQLKGFLHTPASWADIGEMLLVCVSFSRAELNLKRHKYPEIINITAVEPPPLCRIVNGTLEPGKIAIDFKAHRINLPNSRNSDQQSTMVIQHNNEKMVLQHNSEKMVIQNNSENHKVFINLNEIDFKSFFILTCTYFFRFLPLNIWNRSQMALAISMIIVYIV